MDKVVDLIVSSRLSSEFIAKKAKISAGTINRWISGGTLHGHLTTIDKVVRALGKRLEIR